MLCLWVVEYKFALCFLSMRRNGVCDFSVYQLTSVRFNVLWIGEYKFSIYIMVVGSLIPYLVDSAWWRHFIRSICHIYIRDPWKQNSFSGQNLHLLLHKYILEISVFGENFDAISNGYGHALAEFSSSPSSLALRLPLPLQSSFSLLSSPSNWNAQHWNPVRL